MRDWYITEIMALAERCRKLRRRVIRNRRFNRCLFVVYAVLGVWMLYSRSIVALPYLGFAAWSVVVERRETATLKRLDRTIANLNNDLENA